MQHFHLLLDASSQYGGHRLPLNPLYCTVHTNC